MAKQTTNSGLIAKLGDKLRKAHENHKGDDVKYDANGGLPSGIETGVAKLTSCKFGIYDKGDNKGQYYFMARGVVIEPTFVGKTPTAGLQTMIMEPMCETPTRSRKSVDDHLDFVYNEMRKLGVNMEDADPEHLEEMAEAITEAAPYFRFRTWQGAEATTGPYAGKKSRVQEVWNGMIAGYEPEGDGDGVEDETEEAPKPAPVKKTAPAAAVKPAPTQAPKKAGFTAPKVAPEPEPDEEEGAEAPDLDALAKAASGKGKSADLAQVELERLAVEAGHSEEAVGEAQNWAEVVELIRGGSTADAAEEEEPTSSDEDSAEDFVPEKEQVFAYYPVVNGKKAKKAVEVEVTAVDAKSKTATLKDLDNTKVSYKSVPWGDLEQA